MKHGKKLAALLLALVLACTLATTVFASGVDTNLTDGNGSSTASGSITISNAVVGQTYTIYRILELESYDADSLKYVYKATDAWSSFINSDAIKDVYVNVDTQGYVTWKEITKDTAGYENADASALKAANDAAVAAFAKLAQAEATKQGSTITNNGTATASAPTEGQTSPTVSFNDLELGYYLVDSTLGTLCSLDTTNPRVTIEEKNAAPTNEKKVQEDSTNNYGSVNDADIGDTVNFKSTITLPKGSENIVFHDKMSEGLTLKIDSSNKPDVKVYTDENWNTELDSNNYTVKSTGLEDDCTFEISFEQTYLDSLTAASTNVYVKYSATLNEHAVIGGSGNPNTSKVSYGDDTNTKSTPVSTTTTYTWSFDILKYANGDKTSYLAGAEFVLLNSDKSKVATIVNGQLTDWTNFTNVQTLPTNSTITTNNTAKINIKGLDGDTYYLREIKAPAGYNILTSDGEVRIEPTTAQDGKTMSLSPVTAEIENKSGSELPSTGGMGTTLFYIIGGILVVGAGVLLVTKKRMDRED